MLGIWELGCFEGAEGKPGGPGLLGTLVGELPSPRERAAGSRQAGVGRSFEVPVAGGLA